MSTKALIDAFRDTSRYADSHHDGYRYDHNDAFRYDGLLTHIQVHRLPELARIYVKNVNCLDECVRLKAAAKGTVCLLNMASDMRAGGGVHKGRVAQEEDICRRTTLWKRLNTQQYPLGPMELIYCPSVAIIKDAELSRIDPTRVDVISMAAIRNPMVRQGRYVSAKDRKLMGDKIEMVLQTAVFHGADDLVLGAWGCGCFRNPPAEVAALFARALRDRYADVFRSVTFAILEKDSVLGQIFADTFRAENVELSR